MKKLMNYKSGDVHLRILANTLTKKKEEEDQTSKFTQH